MHADCVIQGLLAHDFKMCTIRPTGHKTGEPRVALNGSLKCNIMCIDSKVSMRA